MSPHLDPGLPRLGTALDPALAAPHVLPQLHRHSRAAVSARLTQATLRRHKPGRRCLIEYTLAEQDGGPTTATMAKMRARGLDHRTARLVDALGATAIGSAAAGETRVPRFQGIVPALSVWLQERADGAPGFAALSGPNGREAARRIGAALAAFHLAAPRVSRCHGAVEEMRILDVRLAWLATAEPTLRPRLARMRAGLDRVAAHLPVSAVCTLHRDFYPDQVLVDETCVHLIDLDLAAVGDPALDVGNFTAHLIEHDLRRPGTARLAPLAESFLDGYRARRDVGDRAVRGWELLALARLVAISAGRADRRHVTRPLLDLVARSLPPRTRGR